MRKFGVLSVFVAYIFSIAALLYLKKIEAGGIAPPPLIVKMERARELLNAEIPEYEIEEFRVLLPQKKPAAVRKRQGAGKPAAVQAQKPRYGKRYRVRHADFLLAVSAGENPDDIRIIRFSEILPHEREHGFSFETLDASCDAEYTGGMGISRRFEVRCEGFDEPLPVLAARYMFLRGLNKFASRENLQKSFRSVTYSPFFESYVTSEHVAFGDYVLREEIIGRAYALLRERGVLSRSFPGKPLGDVIPEEFMHITALNEHADHGAFDAWGADIVRKSVLTTIAQNRMGVYPTCNKSGACGLMQFTNKNGNGTYALIARTYPEAGLIPEFPEGALDPMNAVMAAALLFDHELSELPEWVRREYAKNPRSTVLCVAAAYHSGGGVAADVCARQAKTLALDTFAPPARLKNTRPQLWYYLRKFTALEQLPPMLVTE